VDSPVAVDPQGDVDRVRGMLEVAVLEEVDVRQPDVLLVVYPVQVLVSAGFIVRQAAVHPEEVHQELHLVFLENLFSYVNIQKAAILLQGKKKIIFKQRITCS
jgi:hypothetical protein